MKHARENTSLTLVQITGKTKPTRSAMMTYYCLKKKYLKNSVYKVMTDRRKSIICQISRFHHPDSTSSVAEKLYWHKNFTNSTCSGQGDLPNFMLVLIQKDKQLVEIVTNRYDQHDKRLLFYHQMEQVNPELNQSFPLFREKQGQRKSQVPLLALITVMSLRYSHQFCLLPW